MGTALKNSVAAVAAFTLGTGLWAGAAGSAAAAHRAKVQSANVHDFVTGEDLAGAGILTRERGRVWANISASGLGQDAAYTVWWVVFNNPSACSDPCGSDDLESLAVDPAIFYATGFITGEDGTANISAHLQAGRIPDGADTLVDANEDGVGLRRGNGFKAEIHLIVRSHGPILVGLADQQIGSFAGACDVNVCADLQAVAFLPD
ncbi:MAG TPA: hypothetical protein VE592_12145 [Geminicoccaceae bacterium]|nr:hypothetical protein [Geminicoccaceae bacterium]